MAAHYREILSSGKVPEGYLIYFVCGHRKVAKTKPRDPHRALCVECGRPPPAEPPLLPMRKLRVTVLHYTSPNPHCRAFWVAPWNVEQFQALGATEEQAISKLLTSISYAARRHGIAEVSEVEVDAPPGANSG